MRRNKTYFYSLVVVSVALLLASCTCRDLELVESAMESDPAVADSLLNDIPVPQHGRRQALYAVLRTQIDYKLYRTFESDSIIRIATDYYGKERKSYNAAMAWYSRGCVEDLFDKWHEAFDCYMTAMSLFPDTTVRYYAMCLQNVGPIYAKRNMHSDAERVLTACMSHPACAKNSRMYYSSLYNLGHNELYSVELEKADSIFSMILADSLASYFYRRNSLLQLLKICYRQNKDVAMIDSMIFRYPEYISDFQTSGTVLSLKADAWFDAGQLDSAYHYYLESERYTEDVYTQCANAGEMVKLTSLLGLADETPAWFERYETKIDSINRLESSAGLIEIQHKHQMEVEEKAFQERQRRTLLLSLTSVVVFGLLLMVLYLAYKAKTLNYEKDRQELLLTIGDLRLKGNSDNLLIGQLYSQFNSVLSRPYSELDKVYDLYMQTVESIDIKEKYCDDKERDVLYHKKTDEFFRKIQAIFGELLSDSYQAELDNVINSSYQNIMSRLSNANLTDKALLIMRMSIAGFSPRTVSHILEMPVKTFYQNRSRAIQKIESYSMELANEVRRILNMR